MAGAALALPSRPDMLTRLAPAADLIFYINAYPWAAALAMAPVIRMGTSRFQRVRIAILMAALFGVALKPHAAFWDEPPETGRAFIDGNGVCRQTGSDTCSAASAVTLLRLHGIETTETEAAAFALTRRGRGTSPYGLYRALRRLTSGRPEGTWRAGILRMKLEDLLAREEAAIITAGLRPRRFGRPPTPMEAELEARFQWRPGVMHDVVFMGEVDREKKRLRIADPDIGLEWWGIDHLEVLFQGYVFEVRGPGKPAFAGGGAAKE